MKQLALVVLAVVLIIVVPPVAPAQFHLGIAPALGMNFNIHSGSDLSSTGTGFGFVFAGEADMKFSRTFGMIGRLGFYDNRSGSVSSTGSQGGVNYTVDNSVSLAYFNLEPLIAIYLPQSPFFFFAGPSLGFNITGSTETTTTITSPGFTFPGGSTNQTAKSSLKDVLVRFELKAGAGYEIPIAKKISIVPQLSFGFGLTNVVSNFSWHVMSFQLMVPVRFDLI